MPADSTDALEPPGTGVRDFALLQTAAFCGTIATRCVEIALAWWVLDRTGDEALLGVLIALGIATDILSRGALAWLGDRFPPGRVIQCCFIGSALVSGLLTWLAYRGVYELWTIVAGIMLLGVSLGVREPLLMSTIRGLLSTTSVAGAVRVRSTVMSLSSFAGPVAAGVLVGTLGYAAVLATAFGVVGVSTILVVALRAPAPEPGNRPTGVGGFTAWASGTRAGFRAIRRVHPEWRLAMLTMVVNFALYPVFNVIVPVLVAQRFPHRTWVLSVVESAFAVGLIVGSAFLVGLSDRLLGRRRTVLAGFAVLGAGFAGTGLVVGGLDLDGTVAFTATASLLLMLSGVGLCMITTNTGTVRLLATPAAYRNRMVAAASFLSGVVMPLGSVTSGVVSRTSGELWALAVLGVLICLCAVVAARDRVLTTYLDLPDDALDDIYARDYPQAFAVEPHEEKAASR
ncbi:MFS transporter [Streptomyces sp. SID9727]|uniref:MFS transporter n=1 Tax=Streptomyces sp. SID9727 TaxID=2706114 RepID=UPI0013CBCDB9|nr:MFS transporter [Streptomyces sp. SID9727]NEC66050.1 MFS transporter [Streptomyces sp. SID9727]